jgi:hypothetical protein
MSSLANFFVTVKNAISPSILVDSLKTGLFIGLLLNLINYGGDLFDGMVTSWAVYYLTSLFHFASLLTVEHGQPIPLANGL